MSDESVINFFTNILYWGMIYLKILAQGLYILNIVNFSQNNLQLIH